MPRPAKKLNFDEVTAMVSILKAISAQEKKTPLTKPQVAELTELPTPSVTASYKILLKRNWCSRLNHQKACL